MCVCIRQNGFIDAKAIASVGLAIVDIIYNLELRLEKDAGSLMKVNGDGWLIR